jgi:hypothetical protein
MASIDIQIRVSNHGIDTVIARGTTSEDRAETLRVLTRIEPSLAEIDKELGKQK